jgi:hypothetical protein
MPFVLVLIGVLLVVVAYRGTYKELGTLVASEFSGQGHFIWWGVSVAVIGSLGYIKGMQEFSRYFLALLIVVLFLSNGGFFAKFTSAVKGNAS